jgi:hypothetical protein
MKIYPILLRFLPASFAFLLFALLAGPLLAADPMIVTHAQQGKVDGNKALSDEFIWQLFVQFVSPISKESGAPVLFETWASDSDTFSFKPHWPDPTEPKKLRASVLGASHVRNADPLDVPCKAPPTAGVAGFPTTGPSPCIAEEVRRNKPLYEYIVNNNLNTAPGLAAAFAKSFNVQMPTTAIAVKGDWVPVDTVLRWVPKIGSRENVKKLYYTGTSDGVDYALVSLHVSSRQNKNWVWGTFEHMMSPGRCDDLGCWDAYGAVKPGVPPNHKETNSQYGPCQKSPALQAMMKKANLSPVWENYCLKATMVDYTAPDGTPYALGNSVIERIAGGGTVAASSCIACHVYASYGSNGQPTAAAFNILPYNPTGKPFPAVLEGSQKFDFMWGVLNAPTPAPSAAPGASASP